MTALSGRRTGQIIKLCVMCNRRAVYEGKAGRWVHVRPSAKWHLAKVPTDPATPQEAGDE